jgi:hypothetical protein
MRESAAAAGGLFLLARCRLTLLLLLSVRPWRLAPGGGRRFVHEIGGRILLGLLREPHPGGGHCQQGLLGGPICNLLREDHATRGVLGIILCRHDLTAALENSANPQARSLGFVPLPICKINNLKNGWTPAALTEGGYQVNPSIANRMKPMIAVETDKLNKAIFTSSHLDIQPTPVRAT